MLLEEWSLRGASRIAQLSVPERTKRAMLAEAIEDQIFANTERLEEMVIQNAKEKRDEAVELARATKALQVQYQELVSGGPSSVLNSLESVMGGGDGSQQDKDSADQR